MSGTCGAALDAGVIRGVLSAVDCRTRDFAEMGYQSLTGSPLFQTALTLILTIYVAALGYRLEASSQVGANANWAPPNVSATVVGDQNVIRAPLASGTKIYRLTHD